MCSNPSQISELRKSKADWKLIVKSRDTAEAIVDHIKGKQPTINASLTAPNFIGVVKRIPVEMEELDVLHLIPRARQSGSEAQVLTKFTSTPALTCTPSLNTEPKLITKYFLLMNSFYQEDASLVTLKDILRPIAIKPLFVVAVGQLTT